jgi:hypothetical protein
MCFLNYNASMACDCTSFCSSLCNNDLCMQRCRHAFIDLTHISAHHTCMPMLAPEQAVHCGPGIMAPKKRAPPPVDVVAPTDVDVLAKLHLDPVYEHFITCACCVHACAPCLTTRLRSLYASVFVYKCACQVYVCVHVCCVLVCT